jgi:hypothetical protein
VFHQDPRTRSEFLELIRYRDGSSASMRQILPAFSGLPDE